MKDQLNIKIYKQTDGPEKGIKLEVDASVDNDIVHASIVSLLPDCIKMFAKSMAKDDQNMYKDLIGASLKQLSEGQSTLHNINIKVQELKPVMDILIFANAIAQKFVDKVESGKAKSKETYQDMKDLLDMLKALQEKSEDPENEKIHEPVRQWRKWDGEYEKKFYDVKTKDGRYYRKCWPNAGFMNTTQSDHGQKKFGVNDEILVRLSKNQEGL